MSKKNAFSLALVAVALAGQSMGQNNGTRLTAAVGPSSIQCLSTNGALVDITTTITSAGAVDSAEIRTSLNGEPISTSGWIQPQDFVHSGRFKTATASFSEVLENGSHTVQSCYAQSGSDGRLSKQTCASASSFEVNCAATDPCDNTEVFGNIIGNGNLCSGSTIPIQLKGDFGEGGDLVITKDGFTTRIPFERSGNSCVYQARYQPDIDGNAGAGDYAFTFIGDNGSAYSFLASLRCQ